MASMLCGGVRVAGDDWDGTGMDTGMNLVSGGVSLVRGAMRVVWPGVEVVGQVGMGQKKYRRIHLM